MKKTIIITSIFILVFSSFTFSQKKGLSISAKEKRKIYKNLSETHRTWLNMIDSISTKEEKNIFYILKNDRDRDLFIQSFWVQRDPTPGTPLNEYKQEIIKRFFHVNREYKKGSSKPGWMTDMGKFYMILGKPNSIDSFDSKPGLYPAQVWYYFGDKKLGLPTYFNITFFKPHNTTEWKLYNPAQNGPQSLLINWEPVHTDEYGALYAKIKKLAPGLAQPAISMIPNDSAPGIRPSLRANIILSHIYESPKREINAAYATNFVNYKGYVDINSSINYIENTNKVVVHRSGRFGYNFVNITIKPKVISVGYIEKNEKYFYNFKLTVSLKKGDKFIYQYTKNFDFYVNYEDIENVKKGVEIHDSFPIASGNYKLTVFIQNSVGKQFSYFDKDIVVRDYDSIPFLSNSVLGYKTEDQSGNFFFPYNIKGKKLYFNTDGIFRINDIPLLLAGVYNLDKKTWENGYVELLIKGLNQRRKFETKKVIKLNEYSFSKNINILEKLVEKKLYSDYYMLNIKLYKDKGILLDSKNERFTISPTNNVNYPYESFKRSNIENTYYFHYILGIQYENIGDLKNSTYHYEKCLKYNPEYIEGNIRYLRLLNKRKEYTKTLVKVESIKDSEKYRFDYHFIKGSALYGMKDYENALKELLKGNKVYDSDLRLLNLIAFTMVNLKEYEEALKVFNASLKLDRNQPLIIKGKKKVELILKK
ncbi:MAG: GWxTD domain-containing protein [Acidobacteriota bacterium]